MEKRRVEKTVWTPKKTLFTAENAETNVVRAGDVNRVSVFVHRAQNSVVESALIFNGTLTTAVSVTKNVKALSSASAANAHVLQTGRIVVMGLASISKQMPQTVANVETNVQPNTFVPKELARPTANCVVVKPVSISKQTPATVANATTSARQVNSVTMVHVNAQPGKAFATRPVSIQAETPKTAENVAMSALPVHLVSMVDVLPDVPIQSLFVAMHVVQRGVLAVISQEVKLASISKATKSTVENAA